MALPGETIALGAPPVCPDCNKPLANKVLRSGAGFCIGTICDCGPYSRESGYYPDAGSAQTALASGNFGR